MGIKIIGRKGSVKKLVGAIVFVAFIIANSTVALAAAGDKYLVPMGNAVGIELQSEGVMVVGMPEFLSDGKTSSPARDAGISVGDLIIQVGSQRISTNEDLKSAIQKLDGSKITLKVLRADKTLQLTLTPHKNSDGCYELGVWMRNGIAGIGTLTFYDPESGVFGALGHSVCDTESGGVIPLRTGTVMRSYVTDVMQGKAGVPGQLHGTFNAEQILGNLTLNSINGIFGTMDQNDLTGKYSALPAADSSEITTGPATILSNISGTDVVEYSVEITRIYTGAESIGRSMMISVTDEDLIAQTGGIVQGMSGSPIIQNGKLVGAVTHVLINDPTRGYGISIEKMLETISDEANKKAA